MRNRLNSTSPQEKYSYNQNIDFEKIRIGMKTVEDAVINCGVYKKVNSHCGDKMNVLRALDSRDFEELREISKFFYETSGIYNRLCRYMAFLYCYDWMVTPYMGNKANTDKILEDFSKILTQLDKFGVKKFCGNVALRVLVDGCYCGYISRNNGGIQVQELPVNYCRSRIDVNGRPAVEFNMKYFDDAFRDTAYRLKILKAFPKEFARGYSLYKQGKLVAEFPGDKNGWYLLTPENAFKVNINGDDFPAFVNVIPAIIDLDEAQDLNKKKMAQKLLKILIQKLPIDKNGDLVFDVDEAQVLHGNAVAMMANAIGLNVLTTFADVDVADMSDTTNNSTDNDVNTITNQVYTEAGVSQLQFNSSGNIALNNSILNDEASMYNLLLQLEEVLNIFIAPFNKNPKKVSYRLQLLKTTIYNYKEMAKAYKEQTQLGYSKFLPQIALGQSQSAILANAHFENEVLCLEELFIPPMSSSTMSADSLAQLRGKKEKGEVGREALPDSEKSEKTIMNQESMS